MTGSAGRHAACRRRSFPARSNRRPFRAADVPVIIGDSRVGLPRLLPELQADLKVALDMGISLFAARSKAAGRDPAGRRYGPCSDLQLPEECRRSSRNDPILPGKKPEADRPVVRQLDAGRGCLSVLVLCHHQCPGAKVAGPHPGRRRAGDSRAWKGSSTSSSRTTNFARTKTERSSIASPCCASGTR